MTLISGFSKTLFTPGKTLGSLDETCHTVINDKYVVQNLGYGIVVFCFEESNMRPKANGNFFDMGTLESYGRETQLERAG